VDPSKKVQPRITMFWGVSNLNFVMWYVVWPWGWDGGIMHLMLNACLEVWRVYVVHVWSS